MLYALAAIITTDKSFSRLRTQVYTNYEATTTEQVLFSGSECVCVPEVTLYIVYGALITYNTFKSIKPATISVSPGDVFRSIANSTMHTHLPLMSCSLRVEDHSLGVNTDVCADL